MMTMIAVKTARWSNQTDQWTYMIITSDIKWLKYIIGSDIDRRVLYKVIVVHIELGHSTIVNFLVG
jgi:hypothetical protein